MGYDLPGGHLKRGENPIMGLKREVEEETGLTMMTPEIKDMFLIKGHKRFYSCPFSTDDITLSDEHSAHEFVDIEDIDSIKISPSYREAIVKALGR